MTSTQITRAADDPEDPRELMLRRKQRAALEQARYEAVSDALETLVPVVEAQITSIQSLLPDIRDAIAACIERPMEGGKPLPFDKDMIAALKAMTPLLKVLVDENKRILDRVLPKQAVKSEVKVDSNVNIQQQVVHTTLGELLGRRKSERDDVIEGRVSPK